MRLIAALIVCFLPGIALAQSPRPVPSSTPAPPDLVTLSGQTYKAARVFRVEPDGITYAYTGGLSKIPFTDLPEAIRKQYGYDPAKAAAFASADDAQQATLAQAAHADAMAAQRQSRALDVERVADAKKAEAKSDLPTPGPAGSLETGKLESGNLHDAENKPTGAAVTIQGRVLSVDPDKGVILVDAKKHASSPYSAVSGVVAVSGVRLFDKISDGDRANITGNENGIFRYTSAIGAAASVRSYQCSGGYFYDSSNRQIK